jgi:hypothetical protein
VKDMNENIDMIKLEEVIDMCAKYHIQEISFDEFKSFSDKIFIQKYLPISVKSTLINYILLCDEFLGVPDEAILSTEIEMKKFFRIMLAYTNIDTSDAEHLMTMNNYDLVMRYFGDIIEGFCGMDYHRTEHMLENAMNYANINNLINLVSYTNGSENNMTSDLEKTFELFEQNKDVVGKLTDIIKFNKAVIDDGDIKNINENK